MTGGAAASRFWRRPLAVLAALVCLWLAWLIIAVAMARLNAQAAPDEALRWRPNHAAALARKAEQELPEALFDKNTAPVEALARAALAHGPLEVVALRVLGETASIKGDQAAAHRLMSTAAERSLRDGPAQLWMFRYELARGRHEAAFRHGQALLRQPAARQLAARQMAQAAAADPEARKILAKVMRQERFPALMNELSAAMDPGAFFYFLIELREEGAQIDQREAGLVVRRLLQERDVAEAYIAWAQLLPPQARSGLGNVYDGDFEGLPGSPPFNWRLRENFAELAAAPGEDGSSLYIRYDRGGSKPLAEQTLLLAPGAHRLRMRARMENPGQGEQMVWSVTCAGPRAEPLFELTAPDDPQVWQEIAADFVVPDQGCASQTIRLHGRAGDRLDFLQAWFDAMVIEQRGGG